MKKVLLVFYALLLFPVLTSCVRSDSPAQSISVTESPSQTSEDAGLIEAASDSGYECVDLDLSVMSGVVVYAQVYNMLDRPSSYLDKVIRVRGTLNYFRDEKSGNEYFAVLISDATACCAQGIEFVWAGEHSYPQDYPPLGTELTVTGRFELYEDDAFTYVHLADAQVSWL